MEFKEYIKKSSDSSSVWAHFLRSTKGEEAKCKLCMRIFKVSGSTSTLHMHLKKVHAITLNLPSTSIASNNNDDDDDDTPSIKRSKMTHYFKSEDSLDYVIARMVSLDGIAFRLFCTSEDLKKILRKSGYTKLPTSPNTIRNTVMRVHAQPAKL
ncbi:hypothetical protein O0L34_g18406 [Tuta absoluta]|nr:hypothetical protein O0L34_g18406 [Tuta absoluta]